MITSKAKSSSSKKRRTVLDETKILSTGCNDIQNSNTFHTNIDLIGKNGSVNTDHQNKVDKSIFPIDNGDVFNGNCDGLSEHEPNSTLIVNHKQHEFVENFNSETECSNKTSIVTDVKKSRISTRPKRKPKKLINFELENDLKDYSEIKAQDLKIVETNLFDNTLKKSKIRDRVKSSSKKILKDSSICETVFSDPFENLTNRNLNDNSSINENANLVASGNDIDTMEFSINPVGKFSSGSSNPKNSILKNHNLLASNKNETNLENFDVTEKFFINSLAEFNSEMAEAVDQFSVIKDRLTNSFIDNSNDSFGMDFFLIIFFLSFKLFHFFFFRYKQNSI